MSVGSQMKKILKDLGIDQYYAADKLGVSQPRLNQWLNGRREPDAENIQNFCKIFGTTPNFLFEKAEAIHGLHSSGTEFVAEKITSAVSSLFSKSAKDTDSPAIDFLDISACCGTGSEIIYDHVIGRFIISWADFRAISPTSNPENVKMLKAAGDSMTPTINDGDFVLVDLSQKSAASDGIYLLRLPGGLAIKRLQFNLTDTITIKSDNPNYNSFNSTLADVHILGRVFYILNAKKV